jgi:HemY protein
VLIAEEALKLSPGSTWAAHAVLGHRCAAGDWSGAIAILDTNLASGLIDKPTYRRQRGLLLTARALELEHSDRDLSRESVMQAVKLAPTLVPAAVLASKYESEAHQTRRAMRIVETAWLAQPHPDLAEAYAHVRLGDSARQRLSRIEALAAKSPPHIESGLAVARAAIDASDFAKARAALEPYLEAPTQRVAVLMAEIERTEHGDSGRARAWTLRAIRARHDPVWTADGYVSDRWRPVSPVSGRLDAFQWQTPLSALPSEQSAAIEAREFREAYNEVIKLPHQVEAARERPEGPATEVTAPVPAQQDNAAPAAAVEPPLQPVAAGSPPSPPQPSAEAAPVRARDNRPNERPKDTIKAAIPPVIPLVRAPDDPGIDDEPPPPTEFDGEPGSANGQAGGWRGFLTRWGN